MNKPLEAERVKPEVYAMVCPNCNGRSTVGYGARPCPTCGDTDHKGIVYVPVRMNGRMENENYRE